MADAVDITEEVAGESVSTECPDAVAAECAREVGDEVSAMELDQLVGDGAPQVQGPKSMAGSVGEDFAFLTLQDRELEEEFAREPAPGPLAPESLVAAVPAGKQQRPHRRPESRRGEKRKQDLRIRVSERREERRRRPDPRGRGRRSPGRQPHRGDSRSDARSSGEGRRQRVELGTAGEGRTQHRERRPARPECQRVERPVREESRRPSRLDLRHKLVAQRCERLHASSRSGRMARPTLAPERHLEQARAPRNERARPPRSERPTDSQDSKRTTEASGRRHFGVPRHLQDRLAELEAQGWSRKDRRNKRWVVTREDGSKFKIRAAKLRTLEELH